jgi:hypothetical protein
VSVKVTMHVMVGEPTGDLSLCDDCQHATLIELPVWLLTGGGITSINPLSRCMFCSGANHDG